MKKVEKVKTAKWRRRKYSHGFKGPNGKIYVPCTDAKEPVDLGEVTRRFFVLGDPMQECSCAITEYGLTHAHLYPHKVHWIETTRSHHFVVDQLDKRGRWKHCVRYKHNRTKEIDEYDSPGGKAKLLKNPDLTWRVKLFVPKLRKPQTGRGVPEGKYNDSRNQVITPFSRDRWMRALKRHQTAQLQLATSQ